ncbi:MAG: 2Fe-2S iron-sulfur cluster-binding protein [Thiolinea sp.]
MSVLSTGDDPAVYTVRIANTAFCFQAAADETILQSATRQGIDLPWGCGGGICGICMSEITEGVVAYDAPPLALFEEDEEQGKGLICVAYPRSDLLLTVPEVSDVGMGQL